MRKFRNAALAGLTALSLVAGATTATAAENAGGSSIKKNNETVSADDVIRNNDMTAAERYAFFEKGRKILEDYMKEHKGDLTEIQSNLTPEEYQQAMGAMNYFETYVVPQCQDAYDLAAQAKDRQKLAKLGAEGKQDTQEYKDLDKKLTESAVTERLAELKKAAMEGKPGAQQRWDRIEKLALSLRPNMETFDPRDPNCETNPLWQDLKYASSNPKSTSSVLGKRYNAQKDVNAKDLVGSTKNFSRQPIWSQIWVAVTALGLIGSFIGLVFLPFMNQLKNQQVIL